jgi:hypothetical protein
MQSFRYLARVRAWLAASAAGRGSPRVAWLMGMVVVSFTAVLAGSALLHRSAGHGAARRDVDDRSRVASRPGATERPDRSVRPGQGARSSPAGQPPAPTSAADVRADLVGRLGEILRLRERAYARRDVSVLDTIYTADCACLRSGRAAIARLLADHAVWRGRSVSLRVERLSRVSDSLWIALAVLRRSAFRIEREDGRLLSAEPAVRQRYRFALVRTSIGTWLLGHASFVEELPP